MEKESKIQSYYAVNTKQKGVHEAHRWKNVMESQLMTKFKLSPPDIMIKIKETDYPTSKYYIK